MIKHKSVLFLFVLLNLVLQPISSTKKWKQYPGFESASSWDSGYLPCSQDEIVFPESFSSAILLPTTIDITGITLPNDGALLLPLNGEIVFSSGIDNGFKCENSNQMAELKNTPTRHWFDPHNWMNLNNKSQQIHPNGAVPHVEQIPCSNEFVEIPTTGALSIDLSDVRTLRVGQINLDGSNVSREFMDKLFKTELGEMMFKYASLTQIEYYSDAQCGCHKSDVFWDYEWNVCKHVQDMCTRPKCNTPIVPAGHCCAICGVMMKVMVNKCDSSYVEKLGRMIEKSLKEQDMVEKLSYHVSYVDAGVKTYLQVIIVEKDDYEETSIKFMHRFNETIDWDEFKGSQKEFFTSGRPYNPNGLRAALMVMIGTLMGVLVFFAVIFVNFVPDNGFVRLPRWMYVRWYDFIQSPFVFARFDNTAAGEGETAENVVIDVQQYNVTAEYQEDLRGTSTSFDNPMFEDKQIAKSVASRRDEEDESNLISEEDLTEIDLDAAIEGRI